MSSDRATPPPPPAAAAGGDGNGRSDQDGDAELVERRLRTLGSICAVLAAAVLVTAGTIGWAAGHAGAADLMASPPTGSFLIAFGALLLVLLASAVRGRILRRPDADEQEDDPDAPAGWPPPRQPAAARLRAYSWATGVHCGMLAAAAALGALVAASGGALLYGLVICLTALIAMAARWPRRGSFDLALTDRPDSPADRGDRPSPPGGGG
jgi:heme A synthase